MASFKKGKTRAEASAKFVCPVTMQELNGKYPFVLLEKTGKVLSLKAVKEVNGVTGGEAYLQLFPSAEEAKTRQTALINKRGSKKSKNKLKRTLEACEQSERQPKNKVKKGALNNAFSRKTKEMISAAEEKVKASKDGSETYKKLFAVEEEDHTKNGQDKNRLFMMGNPRASVRC